MNSQELADYLAAQEAIKRQNSGEVDPAQIKAEAKAKAKNLKDAERELKAELLNMSKLDKVLYSDQDKLERSKEISQRLAEINKEWKETGKILMKPMLDKNREIFKRRMAEFERQRAERHVEDPGRDIHVHGQPFNEWYKERQAAAEAEKAEYHDTANFE